MEYVARQEIMVMMKSGRKMMKEVRSLMMDLVVWEVMDRLSRDMGKYQEDGHLCDVKCMCWEIIERFPGQQCSASFGPESD